MFVSYLVVYIDVCVCVVVTAAERQRKMVGQDDKGPATGDLVLFTALSYSCT